MYVYNTVYNNDDFIYKYSDAAWLGKHHHHKLSYVRTAGFALSLFSINLIYNKSKMLHFKKKKSNSMNWTIRIYSSNSNSILDHETTITGITQQFDHVKMCLGNWRMFEKGSACNIRNVFKPISSSCKLHSNEPALKFITAILNLLSNSFKSTRFLAVVSWWQDILSHLCYNHGCQAN